MTRTPIVLSALALIVAVVAAVGAFRDKPAPAPDLDAAAVAAMIDEKVAGLAKDTADSSDSDQAPAGQTPALDAETLGPVVRDYLIANPDILEEMLAALESKREKDETVARTEALAANREAIFNSPDSPVVGNPTGDVTLVEFFDYNCGYCKRMLPAMIDLMKTDPNLRVVFKEWPVLSEGSGEAARIALGVLKVAPEKYLDYHVELMGQPGGGDGIGQKQALAVVEKLGLDKDAVVAAAKDPAVDEQISENYKIAEALGLRGTPSYVIGEDVIPGAVSLEELQSKIAKARKEVCQTC
ncbi:DsbA family protein [Microbaculum sp. FT89]|uniref:DsbA family protein n=1 Tax=Microbaculum sp. FT89 TaxID=3447298 RepID=UPI003F52CB99